MQVTVLGDVGRNGADSQATVYLRCADASPGVLLMESQTVEYKRSWSTEHVRTLCAFANGSGGIMYVGVEDDGRAVGVKNIKGLLDDIPNTIWTRLRITADVQAVTVDGRNVIRIGVEPHRHPVLLNGQTFVRMGSSTFHLEGEALTRFILERTGRDRLDMPAEGCGPQDLSAEAIGLLAGYDGPVPYEERVRMLYRLDLVRSGRATMTAALLLHRKPRRFSVGAYIRIVLYEGGGRATKSSCVEGPSLLQPDQTLDVLLDRYVPGEYVYEGLCRHLRHRYPPEAVRELLVNAVQHRDFTASSPVTVAVHQDRIVVSNPCIPVDPDPAPPPPNPGIARIFREAGLADSLQTGLAEAAGMCRENGNPPPEIRRTGYGRCFTATIRIGRKDARRTVATEQVLADGVDRMIFEAVCGDIRITPKALAEIIGRSESTVRRRLRRLEEKGVLARLEDAGVTTRIPIMARRGYRQRTCPKVPKPSLKITPSRGVCRIWCIDDI